MEYTYKYPRPAVTADCIVFAIEPQVKVLLIQRGNDPFKGCWAIPGGFMNTDETTEECAIRELKEETGLKVKKVHQVGTYSKVDRDPRGRTITVAYLAIVDKPVAVTGQDDAAKAEWFPLDKLPELAFDHREILGDAMMLFSKKKYENHNGKKLSNSERLDILTNSLINVFIEKNDELGNIDFPLAAFAVAKLYANLAFMICRDSENPEEIIEVYLDVLNQAIQKTSIEMKIELNNESIRRIEEKIKKIEKVMKENERELENKREELLRKMVDKKKEHGDLN